MSLEVIGAPPAARPTIIGPTVIPAWSNYSYGINNLPDGAKVQWKLAASDNQTKFTSDSTKSVVGVQFAYKPDLVTLTADINNGSIVIKRIIVVEQINRARSTIKDIKPEKTFSGPSVSVKNTNVVLQADDDKSTNFVIKHTPGSKFDSFTYKGKPAAAAKLPKTEAALRIDSSQAANVQTIKITPAVQLSVPTAVLKKFSPSILTRLQIGLIQNFQASGNADYANKNKRKMVIAGSVAKIGADQPLYLDSEVSKTWPWYGGQTPQLAPWNPTRAEVAAKAKVDPVNSNLTFMTHVFPFSDSPVAVIPEFFDGIKSPGKDRIVRADINEKFDLYLAVRTLDAVNTPVPAQQYYYWASGSAPWSLKVEYDPANLKNSTGTNITVTPPGSWSRPKKTLSVPVDILPSALMHAAPFVTWVSM
jgi:hypothetical protein